MNFFGFQQRARKQSRWLVVLFVLAVVAVVAAIDGVLLLVLGGSEEAAGNWQPFSWAAIERNFGLLVVGALATTAVILLASLYRTARLKLGGGQVARDLGGIPVESDLNDPLRQRLRNVVEEIAIASGVPVPEIYVLEQESGINAFAAGFTPSDAAIAVTQGTLERLDRDELQGVVAHEFSHILNGDMRLNIRLMGALFGLLMLTMMGRRILWHTRHIGRVRGRGAAAVFAIAFGVMVVGAIGQFFGRWIKAAVSRQREYLADASAVQFTRDVHGIGGALKKIAVHRQGSMLTTDTEEISHMLFGSGRRLLLFATHPPIERRIRRIDPSFQPGDLDRLAALMAQEAVERQRAGQEQLATERQARERPAERAGGTAVFGVGRFIQEIGQPGWERLLMAATLAAAIPLNLRRAAQSPEWAPQVLFYTLIDADRDLRERQLLAVASQMGADHEAGMRALLEAGGMPSDAQRLPLLELAFPALKRRPPEYVQRVLATVKELVAIDGRIDIFEYLLARVIAQHLWASQNPHAVQLSGRHALDGLQAEALRVLAVLAAHGHSDPGEAEAAFRAGQPELGVGDAPGMPRVDDWAAALDVDLPRLDGLNSRDKERLVRALAVTVMFDGAMVPVELELLRAVCDLIHVPLPLLSRATGHSGGGR